MTEEERKAALEKWTDTPAVNPHYKGATPRQIARVLMGLPVSESEEKSEEDNPSIKTNG